MGPTLLMALCIKGLYSKCSRKPVQGTAVVPVESFCVVPMFHHPSVEEVGLFEMFRNCWKNEGGHLLQLGYHNNIILPV